MKNFLLFISFILAMLPAEANPLGYIDNQVVIKAEKEAIVQWIESRTKGKVSEAKATEIVDNVYAFSEQHELDPVLVLAMIKNESTFNEKAISREGARGLLQVIPKYHREKLRGRNPHDITVSVDAGVQVLKEYLQDNSNNIRLALNKYSGGGGQRYISKIANTHKEIAKAIIEYSFVNEKPITARYAFNKPIHASEKQLVAYKN
jgi:soluble lytic murein transglycosylase-like protein